MQNWQIEPAAIPGHQLRRVFFDTVEEALNQRRFVILRCAERPDFETIAIAQCAGGFVYCVARKGVTGTGTDFSKSLGDYLARCRAATDLPIALGFGVKDRADVDFLRGQVDIAVIGTQTIRVVEEQGVGAVRDFIAGLR